MFELRTALSKVTTPDIWQTYDPATSGSPYCCVFSISRYSAKFDCNPNFSERLYCTSESDSHLFIVRSERYQLYEVKVNGDHKSKRKAMNRNWCNQKANPALNTKAGNK